MAHKVRIDLPPELRDAVEKAVWAALVACPEDEDWDVAVLDDVTAPGQWIAAAAGPKVVPGPGWEVLEAKGRWSRRPDTLYTRTFRGPVEQEPAYLRECFDELFGCFERAAS